MSFPVKQLVKRIDKLAFFVLEVSYITIPYLGGFTSHYCLSWRFHTSLLLVLEVSYITMSKWQSKIVLQVDLDIGDHHMENNQGFTSKDFDKFFSWRGEMSDW